MASKQCATLNCRGGQFHPEYHINPGATADDERVLMNWLGSVPKG